MSIEWGIVMQWFWVVEIFHEYLNLQFWNKAVAVNYNSIHATYIKIPDKISDKWLSKVLNVASYVIYDEWTL